MAAAAALPKRFVQLKQVLEKEDWKLDRISGSHHIFTKHERRCIPVAFHGGTVNPRYALIVLRQAGLDGSGIEDALGLGRTDKQSELEAKKKQEALGAADGVSRHSDGHGRRAGGKCSANIEKSVSNQQGKNEMGKHQREEARSLLLKQEFESLQLGRRQEYESKQHERNTLLEKIQQLVALGEYKAAIELMPPSDNETIGSSSDLYAFQCDILFYRITALSEYAFSELVLNSEGQRDMLNEAFRSTSQFLELSTDRRDDGRDLARKLQERVVTQYLNGLSPVFSKYLSVSMANMVDRAGRTSEALAQQNLLHSILLNGTFTSLLTPDGKKDLGGNNHFTEVTPTREVFNDLMDKVVDGFEFVVSVTNAKNIPLAAAFTNSTLDDMHLVTMSDVCVRKMLIKFDLGDFTCARRLAETLTAFATRQEDALYFHDVIQNSLMGPQFARKSPGVIRGIGDHVLGLIPVYEFALQRLRWRRFAGMLAADEGQFPSQQVEVTNFDDILVFMSRIFEEFERSKRFIKDLVVSGDTRTFIIDTLADPIILASLVVSEVLFEDSAASKLMLMPKLKGTTFDEHAILTRNDKVFRKKKYDCLRVKVARLYPALLRVVQLFDTLLEIDSFAKGRILKNDIFLFCRFDKLPMALTQLNYFSTLLFGPDNLTLFILRYCLVLRNDIDLADNYYVKNKEGELVGQSHLAGGLKSPEAVRSYGMWSFNVVYGTMSKCFLMKFVFGDEARRLQVIDALCANKSVLDSRQCCAVEALALDTLSKLSMGSAELSPTEVQELLLQTLRDPANEDWCHVIKGPGDQKRWAKDRSRKYYRLVVRLRQSFLDSSIENCLRKRATSAMYLLNQLQDSAQKQMKVPLALKTEIEQTKSPDKLVEASKYIKQWSLEELHNVWNHVIELESVAGTACDFFRRATGGAFPEVRSVFDTSWNLRDWMAIKNESFPPESKNAIRDVKYVRAILDCRIAKEDLCCCSSR